MKVFYNPNMSTESFSFSPSAAKPAKAVADWVQRGLDIQIVDFEPVIAADLCLAHDPKFVRGVLKLMLPNGHGNKIKSVTDSCLWTVGSLVAAARQALIDGITCSPTSGFHHACYASNGSFCSFNGIVVTARKLINEGLVSRVGICDCDAPAGNGQVDIINELDLHDVIKNWSFGEEFGHRWHFRQEDLLEQLDDSLAGMKADGVELVILQAGADPHVNDPLSCGGMTTEELRERDQFVFTTCRELGMPVCWLFAGGYQVEADGSIPVVLELHRNTALEAIRVLSMQCLPTSHDVSH